MARSAKQVSVQAACEMALSGELVKTIGGEEHRDACWRGLIGKSAKICAAAAPPSNAAARSGSGFVKSPIATGLLTSIGETRPPVKPTQYCRLVPISSARGTVGLPPTWWAAN